MNTVYSRPFTRSSRPAAGFSLVEMIGVLAIIAILAVIVVPKVFSTIASSRVTNAAASVNTIRTAVTEFTGKYGTIPLTDQANSRLDDLLVAAGMLEGRFAVKIGTEASAIPGRTWSFANGQWTSDASGAQSQANQTAIRCQTATATPPSTAAGRNFQLDGQNNLPAGSRVVYARIMGVPISQARELSEKIDGAAFTQADTTTADNAGRVVYAAPNGQGLTNVFVYVTHQ